MARTLILICGISGAGKTSLVREILDSFDHLKYLKTYTTREARDGEEATFEHAFVTSEEYDGRRNKAGLWNHLEIYNTCYGIDLDAQLKGAPNGRYITIVSPLPEYLRELRSQFPGKSRLLFLDVDPELAYQRMVLQRGEIVANQRFEKDADLPLDEVKKMSDEILKVDDDFAVNLERLNVIVSRLIEE